MKRARMQARVYARDGGARRHRLMVCEGGGQEESKGLGEKRIGS